MPDPAASIQGYLKQIQPYWRKSTTSIMDVALVCAEANRQLGADRKRLIKALPFSQPTFSKLVHIGRDQRLYKADVQNLLPAGYSIIYEICQLKDDQLAKALDAGIIKPTLTRTELAHWLENEDIKPLWSTGDLTYIFAAIQLIKELSPDENARLKSKLEELQKEFGVEIIWPRNRYGEALARWQRRVRSYVVKRCSKIVRSAYRERYKQGRLWRFSKEQISIDPHDDIKRVGQVLDTIGRKDEFDRLLQEAETRYKRPAPPRPHLILGGIKVAPGDVRHLNKVLSHIKKRQDDEKRTKVDFKKRLKDLDWH
jgi:hypothetical protein